MAIADFPAALQPIIQQGFLARAFEASLESKLGFRSVADRMEFPARIGQTITDTRRGLLAPVETPLNPAANSNFDNGMSPTEWSVEQYTLEIAQFGNTMDLNQVTEGVGLANQFVENARVLGINARQSLDRLARNSLFGGAIGGVGGYLGGNTRVTTALAAAGTTVQVDDIRGFQRVMNSMGQVIPVSATSGMTVTVGSGSYTLVNVAADATNVSKAPGGISGTLTFSENVATTDAALNAAVVAATAPLVLRPNGRATTAGLLASGSKDANGNVVTGDYLTIDTMLGQLLRCATTTFRRLVVASTAFSTTPSFSAYSAILISSCCIAVSMGLMNTGQVRCSNCWASGLSRPRKPRSRRLWGRARFIVPSSVVRVR